MEFSIPNLRNLHNDLIESIYGLNDEALQHLQDGLLGYVNYLYGDFIEENLKMDPKFCHLFGNKQNCRGNSVSLDKKEFVKPKYISKKKIPKYKIVNRTEPKKLLEKVEPKSKMIMKTRKRVLKNVADIKDISGNNLGSYFLKKQKSCNKESQRINTNLTTSLIPLQTKIFHIDNKYHVNNSAVENPTFFFIMNRPQNENSLVSKNSSDIDLHYWDLNENIQQNEVCFSNSDYNEKNLAVTSKTKCEITTHGKITSDILETQNATEKGKISKKTYHKKKNNLDKEERKRFVGVSNKKKKTRPAFDIEKYLKTEELKKVERYKYNSGGHLKFCRDIYKEKSNNFENLKKNDKNKFVQNNLCFSENKHISSKQESKLDEISNDMEKIYNCQNKVVVENLPINNFSLKTDIVEANLVVDFNSNRLSSAADIAYGKNEEVKNIKIQDSNKFNGNKKENMPNKVNSEISREQNQNVYQKTKIFPEDTKKFHSKSYFNDIGNCSKKCEISPEENKSAFQIGQEAKDRKECLKQIRKVYTQHLKEITISEKSNVTNKSINSSKIRSVKEEAKQIDKDYIEDGKIVKSVDSDQHFNTQNNIKDFNIIFSEKMDCNIKNCNGTLLIKSSELHNEHKESSTDETISKVSNDSFENSNNKYSTENDVRNFDAHPMNKYFTEPDLGQLMPDVEVTFSRTKKLNQEISENDCLMSNFKPESFSDINLHQTECVQQPINSIISDKKVSLAQLKNETATKLDKSEIDIPPNSTNLTDLKNIKRADIENEIPFEETIIRRSSLRNKTVLSVNNNIETHMLVKITYDKANCRKNDITHKEPRNYKTKQSDSSSTRNSEVKEKVVREPIKTNSSYNLRSSIAKEKNLKENK